MLTGNAPVTRQNHQTIPPAVIAWLAGPPTLRGDAKLILGLIDSLLEMLKPYHVRSVWSSEPRIYRASSRGRARLADAIAARRADSLILDSGDGGGRYSSATAHLHLGLLARLDVVVSLSLLVRPEQEALWPNVASQVTSFIGQWFARLGAEAAYVSVWDVANSASPGDSLNQTAYERERELMLVNWSELREYVRGVFWGMGLGRALCERLGGSERILREAPVFLARPLGDGVWLQLSPCPPAEPSDLKQLAAYLQPLLDWDVDAILARRPPLPVDAVESPVRAVRATHARTERRAPEQRKTVPVQVYRETGTDAGLNLYLATAPNEQQLGIVSTALERWYAEGSNGAFGGGNFHDLTGPSVDGAVMRWNIDFGTADKSFALQSLVERLGALENVEIVRLVVGTESVG